PGDPPMGVRALRWVSFERAHPSKQMDRDTSTFRALDAEQVPLKVPVRYGA
ncbi:hypothetical protein TNCV_2097661, partial [Trichonephila clavipes]